MLMKCYSMNSVDHDSCSYARGQTYIPCCSPSLLGPIILLCPQFFFVSLFNCVIPSPYFFLVVLIREKLLSSRSSNQIRTEVVYVFIRDIIN